ncbi:MAG TPA: phage minor head protein [Methanothrix sp.]|nr:phage minor head protein [Methanothrix sp.]
MDEVEAVKCLLAIRSPVIRALSRSGYFQAATRAAEDNPEYYVTLACSGQLKHQLISKNRMFGPLVLEEIPSLRGKNYFRAHGLNRLAGQMADTDIKYIKKLFIDNWPVHERQAVKLLGDSPLCSFSRARRIGRTESTRAINGSRFEMQIERGIFKYKIWDAVGDSSTRPLHKKRDGVKVRLEESFPFGGRPYFPGDGPAFESILCRCTMGYSTNSKGAYYD